MFIAALKTCTVACTVVCECWIPIHCDATIEWERSGKICNPGYLKALLRNRELNHMRALVA